MEPTYPNLPKSVGIPKQAETAGLGGEQTVKNVSKDMADTAPSNTPVAPKACPVNKNHKVS